MSSPQARFINHPSPKESITGRKRSDAAPGNPVLSGFLLAILSRVLAASTFIQQLLWRLNGFHKLKDLPEVEGYAARWDPTVIPIEKEPGQLLQLNELPKPKRRKNEKSYYTTADYHERYLSGELTPIDVAEALLPLITRVKGQRPSKYSVAYLDVQPELVRAAARASTQRYRAGKPLSPLDGVPVAVKDEVNLKGHSRSLGSRLDFADKLDRTDWCVMKWEEAGAVILGKTNMHELGLDTTNNNAVFGTPLNPHNEGYYTGGSSGGSGCTAAQGIAPVVLGVDGGGSIRIPSAFCGLYGLKPTQGRVSTWPAEHVTSVAVCGPMCPNIDDLALAYRVMAQPCPDDPVSGLFPPTLTRKAINAEAVGRKYIGIDRDWVARSDSDVLEIFNAAVAHYISQGYEVVDISIPLQEENQKAFSLTILAESMTAVKQDQLKLLQHPQQILLNVSGTHGTAQDLIACARLRERAMRHLSWLFRKYPGMLILSPTMPMAGWKIRKPSDVTDGYSAADPDMALKSMEYTCFWNWCGTPAITCPMGYSSGNLPAGIMAVGEWGAEEQLIRFGQGHDAFLGKDGVRRPTKEGNWVDVLMEVKKR